MPLTTKYRLQRMITLGLCCLCHWIENGENTELHQRHLLARLDALLFVHLYPLAIHLLQQLLGLIVNSCALTHQVNEIYLEPRPVGLMKTSFGPLCVFRFAF